MKARVRECAYWLCRTGEGTLYPRRFLSTDPSERYCSGWCRGKALDLDSEPASGDADGDGIFTAEEHARWDANLAALEGRVRRDAAAFVPSPS